MSIRFIAERSPNWFNSLKEFLVDTPAAAVGEVRRKLSLFGRSKNKTTSSFYIVLLDFDNVHLL